MSPIEILLLVILATAVVWWLARLVAAVRSDGYHHGYAVRDDRTHDWGAGSPGDLPSRPFRAAR